MSYNSNMLSNNTNILHFESIVNNESVKNKGFPILEQMFKEHGWHLCKNENNHICYTKFGHETDVFEIKIGVDNIYTGIPIKNSSFKFNTSFTDYFQASEYVEARFFDFIV